MAEWFFEPKGVNEKERDPGWDEYFSSNRSTVESLVRESIQNSLDATAKKHKGAVPAEVRIYYSGAEKALAEKDYSPYLKKSGVHYKAPDCGLTPVADDCAYFVIEDFNTDGLTGDILASNEDEPYFKFLKCENKSTKNEEGGSHLGKWGIGKVVFPIASRIRTFFAYSIRNEPKIDKTHPREILVGESLLKYHTVGEKRYTPDGWWGGHQTSRGQNVPATGESDAEAIAAFKSLFNITRKSECGLSVVVPYVEEISVDELKRSIVENYMVALVSGALKVEFKVGDGPVTIYDREHATDILDFLEILSASKDADEDAKRSAEMFKMVLDAYTKSDADIRHIECHAKYRPEWSNEQFSEDVVKAIRSDLDDDKGGATTVVEVPIIINKKKATDWPEGRFKVILRKTESAYLQVRPRFYRNGLFISHVGANRVSGYMAVVILEGQVAAMLNEAEPPSHTQWFANTGSFAKIYNNAQLIIDYVKLAPRRIVQQVESVKDEDDFDALKGFFSISRKDLKSAKSSGKKKGRGKKGKTRGKGTGSRPAVPPKPYLLEKYTDESGKSCFRVIAHPENFRSFMFTADLSYITISGKNVYDKNDFSFQKGGGLRVFTENTKGVRFPRPNAMEVLVDEEAKNFVIDVHGFDPNRDLEVDDHYRDPKKWNEAEVING